MLKRFCFFFILLFFLPFSAEGSFLIDINAASQEELEEIVGIGPVLAERIIKARPFYSLDDLKRVERIGEKTLQKIKDQGLAWVDPDEMETVPAAVEKSNSSETFEQKTEIKAEKAGQGRFLKVFLLALGCALFLATMILFLKKAVLRPNL